MSASQPVSLIGRIAVQLKLITMEQLAEATAAQGRHGNARIGDILVDKGFVTAAQMEKLKQIQRDVITKQRAKQALSGRSVPVPAPPAPDAAKPTPAAAPAPARPPVAEADSAPRAPRVPAPEPKPPPASATESGPAPSPEPIEAPDSASGDCLGLRLSAASEDGRQSLHALLADAVGRGASDVHLHSGAPLRMRIHGELTEVESERLAADRAEPMIAALLGEQDRKALLAAGEVDFCYAVEGVGRFRTNVYRQQRGFDAVLRAIPSVPPTLEQLGLPNSLARFTNYHQGMVLLTGPAGCGKSSTMAAFVNLINEERDEHILCVEDPIEVLHPSKRCLVNQRHAGRHTQSFARALRAALREDPDVIVIGELRDLETISLAMTAAETGHFVLATLHTNNAVRTINRMIGAFPSNEQDQVRTMLSESLRAVVSQRLVPTQDGGARVPALEILVVNKAISNLIREQKTVQIRSSIQTGGPQGMCLLEQSLNELVRAGTVSMEEAKRLAEDQKLITG